MSHCHCAHINFQICMELRELRRVQVMPSSDMEERNEHGRLPTTNALRMETRDAKMWRRETERQSRTGSRTSRCPCTLCLFGRPLLRTTQAKHIRDYGRHPMRRLQEDVSSMLHRGPLFAHAVRIHRLWTRLLCRVYLLAAQNTVL